VDFVTNFFFMRVVAFLAGRGSPSLNTYFSHFVSFYLSHGFVEGGGGVTVNRFSSRSRSVVLGKNNDERLFFSHSLFPPSSWYHPDRKGIEPSFPLPSRNISCITMPRLIFFKGDTGEGEAERPAGTCVSSECRVVEPAKEVLWDEELLMSMVNEFLERRLLWSRVDLRNLCYTEEVD